MAVLEHLPFGDIRENSREGRVRKHPGSTITRKGYRASLSGPLCNRTCLLVSESALPQETTELSLYLLICYHFLICSAGESTGEWIPLYTHKDYTPYLSNKFKCVESWCKTFTYTKWVQPFSLIISIYRNGQQTSPYDPSSCNYYLPKGTGRYTFKNIYTIV